jgi:hypothetical protein
VCSFGAHALVLASLDIVAPGVLAVVLSTERRGEN